MKAAGPCRLATMVAVLAFAGCGSAPPVGTWKFSGGVPNQVDATLTFSADGKYTLVEHVAPTTQPAGSDSDGCVTTHTTSGTYSTGNGTLTFVFARGTANAVSGCSDPSQDSAGTPMTPDALTAYTDQGMIPPAGENFTVNGNALVLEPGFGHGIGTKLSKAP